MVESYTEQQARTLYYIGIPFAVISMIGCVLVFRLFYQMYGANSHNYSSIFKRFTALKPIHEFVLLIAVCNFIGAIGNILGVGYPYQSNLSLCRSRQALAIFGGYASFQLSCVMAYIMHMTVFYPNSALYLKLLLEVQTRRIIEIIIIVISLILTLSPIHLYCTEESHRVRLIFYIPMVITLVFISFCYLRIIYFFLKKQRVIDENDMRIYKEIRLYPAIMLFCLLTGLIRRIYNVAKSGSEPPFGFAIIQIVAMYSYGAFISAVYLYSVKVGNPQPKEENTAVDDGAINESAAII